MTTLSLTNPIVEIQEWAWVFWVRFASGRPRFMSKKQAPVMSAAVSVAVGRATPVPGKITTNARPGWSSGWVGKIERGEHQFTIQRAFLKGDRSGLSNSGKGDILYPAEPGYYEVDSVARSYESVRERFKIENNSVTYFESELELIADIWGVTVEEVETYRANKAKAEAEEAKTKAQEQGLAELDGSDKQIAWAASIRMHKLAQVHYLVLDLPDLVKEEMNTEEEAEIIRQAEARLKKINSAKWWIEHRDTKFSDRWLLRWMAENG